MRIIVDMMGADRAPLSLLEGCAKAVNEGGSEEKSQELLLVGNERRIRACAKEHSIDLSPFTLVHAENEIAMDDPPLSVRTRPDTSLKVGMTMLAEGKAEALVSAGNTGAVQTAATLFVRRCPGILRSAIGTVLPTRNPVLLTDAGANTTYTPEMLREYALMGSIYMQNVFSLPRPRVGLLNIGKEKNKGRSDYREAYSLLESDPEICFIGNVEASEVPNGVCDVLVSDGFSGNVLLKSIEGMSAYLISEFADGDPEKARALKKRFDPAAHGGAMLLGISKPVIKAHGSSNGEAIKNAIFQARKCAGSGICRKIAEAFAARGKLMKEYEE